jgi:pimeloyl-ACP methyl ester carboxylesterase
MRLPWYGGILLAVTLGACTADTNPAGPVAARTEAGFMAVDTDSLYYEAAGQGEPVVLIHGTYGDRRMWDPQFETLATAFRVIRYDHRGFGRSPASAMPYSPVQDLLHLLDRLHIERAHLVGNSLGGSLAIAFALQHPERVKSIVTIAGQADGFIVAKADRDRDLTTFQAARRGGAEGIRRWLAHPSVAVAMSDSAVAPRLRKMAQENQGIFQMANWPVESLTPKPARRLGEIKVPALVIVGARDTRANRALADSTAQGIKGARLVTIAGADHLPQLERPDAVNRLLAEFLRGK